MSCCKTSPKAQKSIRWTILCLSILAFIFASVAVGHCSFMQIRDVDDDDKQGYGLFSIEVPSSDDLPRCLQYSEGDLDGLGSAFKTSRAFGILAALMTGFAMIGIFLVQFCLKKFVKPLWLTIRILVIVSLISQNLTFAIFGIDECTDEDFGLECTLGAAGVIASLNTIIIIALIVLSWIVPAPEKPMLVIKLNKVETCESPVKKAAAKETSSKPASNFQESKKVTVVEGPNGERTTTEEIIHADGSKTITTSVETFDNTRVVEIGSDQPVVPSRSSYATARYGEP